VLPWAAVLVVSASNVFWLAFNLSMRFWIAPDDA
jgi:hypothetical protein